MQIVTHGSACISFHYHMGIADFCQFSYSIVGSKNSTLTPLREDALVRSFIMVLYCHIDTTKTSAIRSDSDLLFPLLQINTCKMVHHIFLDESCQNGHKYMVLGGLKIDDDVLSNFESDLNGFKEAQRMTKELKWGKVSASMLAFYQDFLNIFFEYLVAHQVEFHSIVIDCSQLNHAKYNNGDPEVGFGKFTYQLLMRIARECKRFDCIYAHLDNRNSNQSLDNLRDILNNGYAKKVKKDKRPFKRVQYVDSKKSNIIQTVDLLIGAISYQKNGKHKCKDASTSRQELIKHICTQTKLKSLEVGTSFGAKGFTIWEMEMRSRK